ncbi:uncharacterized protein Z520_03273 [Fonsecaea multimorphosa CBS 102226]|uniref:Fungal N-terminal domain-containing protein n=1 Tax=Fonsecaea multimorphosa CBS 102226 TaxID=1442371 RepID=A0A0D2KBY4_9EURO|nr:uncharacterized protein Z520_03273 [Fonsecaea multimorphosa CBS 102226]KIY00610.1 hypothetical protein Z520_03273 [Fonsecaea multimorphosa CBS 102226]OAL19001.1 hypothetical protein AYO22_10330 [Fonsecaea multimorphosa]
MAEVLGVVAAAAQILGTVRNALLLALEIRRELLKGPLRIQAHIECLDSTISVLKSVQHESDSCTYDTEIRRFVQAVDNKIQALYKTLRKHLQSISGGSFRKFVGALNTSKSEGKINGAFAALDREKTNLHLFISIGVRAKLDLLISRQVMIQHNSGRGDDCDDVEMSDAVDLADGNSHPVRTTGHQSNGCVTAPLIPSNLGAPSHAQGIADSACVSMSEQHTMTTTATTSFASSFSLKPTDPARDNREESLPRTPNSTPTSGEQNNHVNSHKIRSKSKYKKDAKVHYGDKVVGSRPTTLSGSMDVKMEERYGENANVHVGHEYCSNDENGSR